jgi:hypothetical protein
MFLLNCSDGDPPNALDGLSEPEQERINEIVDTSEDAVGFRLIFPTYLPAYLDPVPTVSVLTGRMPVLIFDQQENYEPATEEPVISSLALSEEPQAGRSCPPCAADLAFESVELEGRTGVEGVHFGEGRASHEIHLEVAGIFVYLSLDWETTTPNFTDDMREEAFRIAESIIDSAE